MWIKLSCLYILLVFPFWTHMNISAMNIPVHDFYGFKDFESIPVCEIAGS